MCLDVFADDKRKPHLAKPDGGGGGQQWRLEALSDGFWHLSNHASGDNMFPDLAGPDERELYLTGPPYEAQHWHWTFTQLASAALPLPGRVDGGSGDTSVRAATSHGSTLSATAIVPTLIVPSAAVTSRPSSARHQARPRSRAWIILAILGAHCLTNLPR